MAGQYMSQTPVMGMNQPNASMYAAAQSGMVHSAVLPPPQPAKVGFASGSEHRILFCHS